MPTKARKYPVPRQVPVICRVFRRRMLSKAQWRELGRPDWVIRANERYRAGRGGGLSTLERGVFYRTQRPAYLDLDVIIHTTDYTLSIDTGTTTTIGLELHPTEVEAVELVEHDQADARQGRYSNACRQLWWARGLSVIDVQEYQIGD